LNDKTQVATIGRQLRPNSEDEHTLKLWSKRKESLKRFDVKLPTLSDVIDTECSQYDHIIDRLRKFEHDRGGLAVSTLRMLVVVLKKWKAFCVARELWAFPHSNSKALELFLMKLVVEEKSIATVSQYRSQLLYFFDYLEIYNPGRSPDVKSIIKSLKQDHVELTGEAYQQEQATPFRLRHLEALQRHFNTLKKYQISITDQKAMAVVATAYGTALREDEICRIKKRHLHFTHNSHGKLAIKLLRTRSKTGVDVRSKWINGECAKVIKVYFDQVSGVLDDEHYLFSSISRCLKPLSPDTAMTGKTVDRLFYRLHKTLKEINEIDPTIENKKAWSGHSARIGRVQDAYQIEKLSFLEIERLGDWKLSTMVKRYLREILELEELDANK